MSSRTGEPGHATRTTVLVAVALAVLLAVAYAVTSRLQPEPSPPTATQTPPAATPTPTPPPSTASPRTVAPTPRTDTPQPGKAYPVRRLGGLTDRSVIVNGSGHADLRYARQPRNGTRVHLTCRGCDVDTWLVEEPSGATVGGAGPLEHPRDAVGVLDVARPRSSTDLLVRARTGSEWTVTLTPFDQLPVHEQSFDALGDDVVAVRAYGDVAVTCPGPIRYRTLARGGGAREYAVVARGAADDPATTVLHPAAGSDLLVLDVSCPGRWSVAVP